jgi:hypothetical protein
MIVAFSTSSPITSVALFQSDGSIVAEASQPSERRSSSIALELLESFQIKAPVTVFATDIGPGSFTGVRVGIVLAKTLALVQGAMVAGVSSFDLISRSETAFVPAYGDWSWVRAPDQEPLKTNRIPEGAIGYGRGQLDTCPLASRMDVMNLVPIHPAVLVPNYLADPHITLRKKPLSAVLP